MVVLKVMTLMVMVVVMMIGSESDLQVTKGTRAKQPLIQIVLQCSF